MSSTGVGGVFEDLDRTQHHLSIDPPKSRRFRDDMTVNVVFFDKLAGVDQIDCAAVGDVGEFVAGDLQLGLYADYLDKTPVPFTSKL